MEQIIQILAAAPRHDKPPIHGIGKVDKTSFFQFCIIDGPIRAGKGFLPGSQEEHCRSHAKACPQMHSINEIPAGNTCISAFSSGRAVGDFLVEKSNTGLAGTPRGFASAISTNLFRHSLRHEDLNSGWHTPKPKRWAWFIAQATPFVPQGRATPPLSRRVSDIDRIRLSALHSAPLHTISISKIHSSVSLSKSRAAISFARSAFHPQREDTHDAAQVFLR